MKVGILGHGEVGSAIHELIGDKHEVFVRELEYDQIKKPIEILHVCIPYSNTFIETVSKAVKELKPKITIINSTVTPGTTQAIYEKTQSNIAHAPFMGVHPIKPKGQFTHGNNEKLKDYFNKFKKVIGPINEESWEFASNHFESLGLNTHRFDSPLESELAKILSTTYYGWNIIFQKWAKKLCDQTSANFDQVYTEYNVNYNQGYQNTLPHVVRPVLKHHEGPIGGHCVIPNAELLQQWLHDDFTSFLLSQNKKLHSKSETNSEISKTKKT